MTELTAEKRAEWRKAAKDGFAACFGRWTDEQVLSLLDALDAAEAKLATTDERAWHDVQRCHHAIDPEQGMGMNPVYCSVPRRYHVNKDHEFKEPKPLDKMGAR